jgi:hypothetical protein
MLGPAIYSKLSGDAAVAAIVGTRIFPEDVPQTLRTFPLIVYTMGDAEHLSNFTGSSHLANRRVTIESAAMTYEAAQGLRTPYAPRSRTNRGRGEESRCKAHLSNHKAMPNSQSSRGRTTTFLSSNRSF